MKKYRGLLFVLLTYLLTWSVEIPAALTKHGYTTFPVPKWMQTICTLSPGFVALFLTALFFKKKGLKKIAKAVVTWKVSFQWYLFVIILGIGLCGLSLLLFNVLTGQTNDPDPAYNFIFYFILILPLSALWEEIGWRGFLLPVLRERFSSLQAALLIGFIWGLWHLPVYLAINPYGDQTMNYFLLMFVGCLALSIILTWLYQSTRGSLLICILFHNAINTSAAYFYGNLTGHEFRPLIILVVFLSVSAIYIGFKTRGSLDTGRQGIRK